jgi:pyruvate,orthophosphate dikinase
MQDMEFTIEKGKLWMLQTRDGKRTAQAAVRIAVEMAEEGLIDRQTAVLRVKPEQVDFFLHPQFDPKATAGGKLLARGLNVSPGAAVGQVAFDADMAEAWAKNDGKSVIMVRPETKPDDVHGMLAAQGILTSRGGRTSHAALVARQFGKPAVVGASTITIDLANRLMTIGNQTIHEGEWISIDGTAGVVYEGQLETMVPDIKDPWLIKCSPGPMNSGPWGCGPTPTIPGMPAGRWSTAPKASACAGPSTCFSKPTVCPTSADDHDRLPRGAQRGPGRPAAVSAGGFCRPVPGHGGPAGDHPPDRSPLHEFLPDLVELVSELADLKIRLKHAGHGRHRYPAGMKSAKKSSCASGPRACGRPTPCWACGGFAWAFTFRN